MSRAQVTRFMWLSFPEDVSVLRIDIGEEVCIQCTGEHVNCCLKWGGAYLCSEQGQGAVATEIRF